MNVITIKLVKSRRDGLVEICRSESVGESPVVLLQILDHQRKYQLRHDDIVASGVPACTTKRTHKLSALKGLLAPPPVFHDEPATLGSENVSQQRCGLPR